jgi:MoxR-like ATPase
MALNEEKKELVKTLEFEINEVFTPSSPIREGELFAGRNRQIIQLNEAIIERGRHAILFGERGVGKTSLSEVVKYSNQNEKVEKLVLRTFCDPSDDFTSIWKKYLKR